MTAPSDRWNDRWHPSNRSPLNRGQGLSRWRAHLLSHRFSGVGVNIPAAQLRRMSHGGPASPAQATDVSFAIAATETLREQRRYRIARARRRMTHWLVVGVMVVASLNLLACLGYLFISLALHEPPP